MMVARAHHYLVKGIIVAAFVSSIWLDVATTASCRCPHYNLMSISPLQPHVDVIIDSRDLCRRHHSRHRCSPMSMLSMLQPHVDVFVDAGDPCQFHRCRHSPMSMSSMLQPHVDVVADAANPSSEGILITPRKK
jgi:hypothetical protein